MSERSQMAAQPAAKVSTVEVVEKFLFSEFPSKATFTTKDYEKDAQQTTTEAVSVFSPQAKFRMKIIIVMANTFMAFS